jgi:hypothetical protein
MTRIHSERIFALILLLIPMTSLRGQPFSNGIILSWPASQYPFSLESTLATDAPWTVFDQVAMQNGQAVEITVNAPTGARFFRMRGGYDQTNRLERLSVDLINGYERGPSLSSDGLSLYFFSEGSGNRDLWVSTRASITSAWREPVSLQAINTRYNEAFPVISGDNCSLLFSDWFGTRNGEGEYRPDGFGAGDLWVSTRPSAEAEWQVPINLGSTINTEFTETTPAISGDGRALIFASDRPDGYGNFDLWITTRNDPSDQLGWTTPTNLGDTINTTDQEWAPNLSRDGLTLYFISNRAGARDGYTFVWVAKRNSLSEPFGSAVNLVAPFPEFQDMFDPCISADGSMLLVSSRGLRDSDDTRLSGPYWHLWQLPIIPPPALSISLVPSSAPARN